MEKIVKTSDISKGEKVALFSTIAIETAAKCNRHCYFCPNDYHKRPDEYMSEDMFHRIIENLRDLGYKKRIALYIYNEPTRDERLIKFIRIIRYRLKSTCIMINTNGDYFKSASDVKAYFDAGLNQMQINIYSNADRYQQGKSFDSGVEQATKRSKIVNQWAKSLGLVNGLGIYDDIGPNKQVINVEDKFGIVRNTDIKGVNHFTNRAGNIPDFKDISPEPIAKGCVRPFRILNINWKGQGILCCNDYYGQTDFGNIKTSRIEEIWNNVELHKYRLKLQNKDRKVFLCNNCDHNGGYYTHLINKVTFGSEKKDAEIQKNFNYKAK